MQDAPQGINAHLRVTKIDVSAKHVLFSVAINPPACLRLKCRMLRQRAVQVTLNFFDCNGIPAFIFRQQAHYKRKTIELLFNVST